MQYIYKFINFKIIVTYVVKQIHFEFWYLAALLHSCLVDNLLRLNSTETAKVEEPTGNYYYFFFKILTQTRNV